MGRWGEGFSMLFVVVVVVEHLVLCRRERWLVCVG